MNTNSSAQTIAAATQAGGLQQAKAAVAEIDRSAAFQAFVAGLRNKFPWRFEIPAEELDRDFLRIVDHHLHRLIPLVQEFIGPGIHKVLDFGCGTGGSSIALALTCPQLRLYGTDIDKADVEVARDRAKLYSTADRCEFTQVEPSRPLPYNDGSFDFCLCSSVLEYTDEDAVRPFCIREMVRLVRPGGLLFFSVPNRLYPFEVHTRKWGWNYFPRATGAHIVDSTFWEVRRMARPETLTLYRTPVVRLFKPWTNFCVRKELR
jgi:SAM-dependent methyltransferase